MLVTAESLFRGIEISIRKGLHDIWARVCSFVSRRQNPGSDTSGTGSSSGKKALVPLCIEL